MSETPHKRDSQDLSGPWIDIKRRSDRKPPLSQLVFPPELEGATSELVGDLEDILQQWGFMHLDEGVYRFEYASKNFDSALMMSGPISPQAEGFARLIIFRNPIPRHGMHIIKSSTGERILWDQDLPADEASKLKEEIDAMGREVGLIDPETGERIPLPDHIRLKS